MSIRGLVIGLLAALTPLAAAATDSAAPLRVVASFSILADMVNEVGGPAVDVQALVGPNADPHGFEPSPSDARRLARAELVVVNGLGFEGWMERLIAVSGFRGPIVVATQGVVPRASGHRPIVPSTRLGASAPAAAVDPHAWQDLGLAQTYVANIRDALAAARPAQAGLFHERAADYAARLRALDAAVRASLDAIPRHRRRVLTSHDAFGYFGAAYGVDMLAVRGLSSASEPSAARMAQLVDQVRGDRVRAIFVESAVDPRLIQQIARDTGVVVGGRLYSDALTPRGTEADTFLKMSGHNARLIASALSGDISPP